MTLENDVKSWANLDNYKTGVEKKLNEIVEAYSWNNSVPLLKFMNNYVSWNGYFALAGCALTTKIGLNRDLFHDSEVALNCAADRANYVASFVFDAARDEFNEGTTPRRA